MRFWLRVVRPMSVYRADHNPRRRVWIVPPLEKGGRGDLLASGAAFEEIGTLTLSTLSLSRKHCGRGDPRSQRADKSATAKIHSPFQRGKRLKNLAAAVSLLGLISCASSRREPPSLPPASISPPVAGGLRVELSWVGPADLDLYVTDPAFESVYFANTPSRSGGRLESDARCGTITASAPSSERIVWHDPPAGPYRVGVDYIESCDGSAKPVGYRVRIDSDGQQRDLTGSIGLQRFQPMVTEFVVPVASGDDGNTQTQEVEP